MTDEDVEYLRHKQVVFFSQGEDFVRTSSLEIYDFIKNSGQGGYGTVKLYRHIKSKKLVAIKFINIKSLGSTERVDRVFKEIAIL